MTTTTTISEVEETYSHSQLPQTEVAKIWRRGNIEIRENPNDWLSR